MVDSVESFETWVIFLFIRKLWVWMPRSNEFVHSFITELYVFMWLCYYRLIR